MAEAIRAIYDKNNEFSAGFIAEKQMEIKDVAKSIGHYQEAAALIDYYAKNLDVPTTETELLNKMMGMCSLNMYGRIANITDNYTVIMENDPFYATVQMNEMSSFPEIVAPDGKIHRWSDAHSARSRSRIERLYGIHSKQKHDDAFIDFINRRTYNPIKTAIECIKWDGTDRITQTLSKWMGAEDSEYTREVSRLIFAGGIHRLYHPGCKFEDMPVLIGGQGAGKSSFVRFLALEDRFFSELVTLDGKEGMENIEGSWIVEVSELLALTKTKEQEAVKAYLSRLTDKFRPAWGHYVVERPRTCIFLGTSNRENFITDKTGGRRFYPVHCKNTGYYLFDHESECREYIRQCWAEALHKIDTDFMAPFARREIRPLIEGMQEGAMEDDYRIGMIQSWLDEKAESSVCGSMIWEQALQQDLSRFTKADQTQIGLIMNNITGWQKSPAGRTKTFGKYGRQRYWTRCYTTVSAPTYTTPNDFTPF